MSIDKLERAQRVSRRITTEEHMEANLRMFEQMGLNIDDVERMAESVDLKVDDLLLLNTKVSVSVNRSHVVAEETEHTSLASIADALRRIEERLQRTSTAGEDRRIDDSDSRPLIVSGGLIIDPGRFTVEYNSEGPCFLGSTIPFSLITRLARRFDTFHHYDKLKLDVWRDEYVSDDTVGRTARYLRSKLADSGIVGITLDTSQKHHVALMRS